MTIAYASTEVSVERSVEEIQRLLVKHDATEVRIRYEQGRPVAVAFLIETEFGPRAFALPANVERVWPRLIKENRQGKLAPRFTTKEQAARVAWRIVRHWLKAQIAVIESGLISMDELLLPYLVDPRTGQTLYQIMAGNQLALPAAGESR